MITVASDETDTDTPRATRSDRSSRRMAAVVVVTVLGLFGGLTYGSLELATDLATRQVHERVRANAAVGVTYVEDAIGAVVELVRSFSFDQELLDAVGDGSVAQIDPDRVEAIFGPVNRRNPGISAMALITVDGHLAAVSPHSPALAGVDLSDRDWFRGVRSTQDVYVSEAYVSVIAGHPRVVGIAAPIRSAKGTTVAYFLITYEVLAIDTIADRFAARDISFTVTDQRGVVVGGSGAVPGELVSLRGDPGIDAALAGHSLEADRFDGDAHLLSASSPVPGIGWTVRADVAAATAYTSVRSLRQTLLSLAGAVVLGLCGALAALGRSARRRRQAEERVRVAARHIEAERDLLRISLAETQAAEFRYRAVTDHLPDTAVMVWDTELRLETVTGPGARTWRYEERNVTPGRLLEEIVDAEEAATLRPFYESGLLAPGTLEHFSVPTGLFFQFDVTPMPNADGDPERVLVMVRDITDRKQVDLRLRYLADHDALTGLLNRRGFEAELDRHVDNVSRYGASGALLLLDLDHFKQINDTLGHNVGDEIIISAVGALRRRLRTSDVIARLGGDEFAVILHRVDSEQAELVAQDLVEAVRVEASVNNGTGILSPTVSVGVAPFQAGGVSAKQMLVNADLAMYQAKAAGRDRYATHHEFDLAHPAQTNSIGER